MVAETDLWVLAEHDYSRELSAYVAGLRGELEAYIALFPDFQHSLVPVPVADNAPEIARRMACGAKLAGVGPFAAVAGVIAQLTAEAFAQRSPEIVVENGGDIYICGKRDRVVGLLPDPENEIVLGLALKGAALPMAVCSSSAKIGHSLSFGQGDLVTVLAPDGAFADAAATALCNMLQKPQDVSLVIEQAKTWRRHGLCGVFAQCGDKLGVWGDFELQAL